MQRIAAKHGLTQSQAAAPQRKSAAAESPQGERIAQLEVMTASETQMNRQAQLARMIVTSPAMAAQCRLIGQIHDSPAMIAQRAAIDGVHTSPRATAQRKTSEQAPQTKTTQRVEAPARINNTGLPDKLKSGIESLSGMSMDNVKVHHNSPQPAQLNALAYAQGTDIHVAPGQEQHLPHEAWHVVQQAQGRVKPTMQMKDGMPINDDHGLEREADVMGARALAGGDVAQRVREGAPPEPGTSAPARIYSPVQRVLRINSSPLSPLRRLKYGQFQSLRKRYGLSADGMQWLRAMATGGATYQYANWGAAISAVSGLKWDEAKFHRFLAMMRKPQDPYLPARKYGDTVTKPTMRDAHGVVEMVNYISNKYLLSKTIFVSPGASADPFAVALRLRGAVVVDIPLSGIKRDKLGGEKRRQALTYVRTCFNHIRPGGRQIAIFDAVISGSALVILRELIGESLQVDLASISMIGLNNPSHPDGQKLKKDGSLDEVPDGKHARFAKERLESQAYKLDIFGRIYPKYELSELTDKLALRKPTANDEVLAKMMALVLAMEQVATEPYQKGEDSDDD